MIKENLDNPMNKWHKDWEKNFENTKVSREDAR